MKAVSNLQAGRMTRSLSALVLVGLSTTALGGFALRPTMSIDEARAMRGVAEQRVAQYGVEQDRFEAFEGETGQQRLDAVLARVKDLVPSGTTELHLHSLIRLAASACDFEMESLSVEDPVDPGFVRLDDVIVMRNVEVRGTGPLTSVPNLVSTLRALGFPTVVQEFSTSRLKADSPRFQSHAVLGICEAADLSIVEDAEEPFASQGEIQ